eukprot:g35263.t1
MIAESVVPNDIKSRHPPFQVPNTNQVQVGTVHPVAPSVCPSSDDIITSVVFFPFPYPPFSRNCVSCYWSFVPSSSVIHPHFAFLLRRHNPTPYTCTFIPCRPCSFAMCPCSRQCFLLRLVLCLSFVRYSLPSHLIAMPQFDLCLNNGIHCDLVPVPTGHISPSIFVSISVAPGL